MKRDYNIKLINGLIRSIGKIQREDLLPYKCEGIQSINNFKYFLNYDCKLNLKKKSFI